MVRNTLRSILDSPQFRKSKRYPTLLEHVVSNTLEGNPGMLKERTIGSVVFGRSADYDTSNDPVVRIAAGEVRKRMELYFGEHPEAPVRIELPVGGYRAEFHFRSRAKATAPQEPESDFKAVKLQQGLDEIPSQLGQLPKRRWIRTWGLALTAAVLLVGLGALLNFAHLRSQRDLWSPVLQNSTPALIVLGGGVDPGMTEEISNIGTNGASASPLVLGNALAAGQVCSIFREYSRDCKVLPGQTTTISDIHGK